MTTIHAFDGGSITLDRPSVRTIGTDDLKAALRAGFDDFLAMPTHVIFVSLIYPLVGLFFASATFGYDVIPLLFPLASGFALIGPFAAIGLYELSRRRELGLDTSWGHAFESLRSPAAGAIGWVGVLLAAIFVSWLIIAQSLYWALFGDAVINSIPGFVAMVLTTWQGWALILIGNLAGFAFALLALTVSAVSIPLILDRNVNAVTALDTSMRLVAKNPVTMVTWGFLVASLLVLGSLPLFVGLAVVMPILGHATWHLYRRAVAA